MRLRRIVVKRIVGLRPMVEDLSEIARVETLTARLANLMIQRVAARALERRQRRQFGSGHLYGIVHKRSARH